MTTVYVDLYSEAGRTEVPEVLAKVVVYNIIYIYAFRVLIF